MIESVPKEFNMDDRETTEDLYETPYEISMLRVRIYCQFDCLIVGLNCE